MAYTSVTVEGGLLSADLLDRIAVGDADGQKAAEFGLDGSRRLVDEIQSAFSDARSFWDAFQRRLETSRESPTTITRENWIIPFLELLGFYDIRVQRSSTEAGGESFFISHRAGDDPDAPPVHVVAVDQEIDRRDRARRSPHALVQDFLNRSDALWGITTNGRRLRLLRDSERLAKPTYLEFDLEGMVEGNLYSEFVLLYRLLHGTRFPKDGAGAHECLLERYYQQSIDEGGRVRDKLRDGVEQTLRALGTAFLAHPDNTELREKFDRDQLDAPRYYRQLLRLVYRLLFLMVAEERRLIFPPDSDAARQAIYSRYYGIGRLRNRADRYFAGDRNCDLWLSLRQTFRLFRDDDDAHKLGLSALNGELFGSEACADLEGASCSNESLISAIRHLSTYLDDGGGRRRRRATGVRRRVNYAGLDVEEFGSVYESLLDFHPEVTVDPPQFDLVAGSERKQTGSYYTPPELVRELIESALVPVLEERLAKAKTKEEKERALLDLRVCDPAAGSGHFLLAAARRIARELGKVRSDEDEPSPADFRGALRDVIRQCIYAVDKNPLAVDLCKVALWIEGHSAGLPLSFLDHHVKCGDSLVGVFDLDVLLNGIPDKAYKPVTGDDKQVASAVRKRNKAEREGQLALVPVNVSDAPAELAPQFAELARHDERAPDDVHAKEQLYAQLRAQGSEWWKYKVACDLWTAAFFTQLRPIDGSQADAVPSTDTVRRYLAQPDAAHYQVVGHATGISQEQRFFHWPLEFADVFAAGGFDVVLGNPPWERIKLQEQEFFAVRNPEIAAAPNKAARERLIRRLEQGNDALAREFAEAKYKAAAQSKFVRESGRFPLTGVGDVNTYALFTEQVRRLLAGYGRAGAIVPDGIANNATTAPFFNDLIERRALRSIYGFRNERFLFPGIDHRVTFCLITVGGPRSKFADVRMCWEAWTIEDMKNADRTITLSADDFALLNPNTRTCPVFRSQRDADITTAIYRRVPVLMKERPPEDNPWGISFMAMFHMANDSHLFRTREQLDAADWQLEGNIFVQRDDRYLPLYEAKMLHQFDHRFGTYDGQTQAQANQNKLPELDDCQHADPEVVGAPRYWVPEADVEARLAGRWDRGWLLGWRDITNVVVFRTVIADVIPRMAVGHKLPLVFPKTQDNQAVSGLYANLNGFLLDYVGRQKVGGTSLTYFYLKQFPILPPDTYREPCPWSPRGPLANWIAPRVLELTYTAWDIQAFARDLGYDGPPFLWDHERRMLLRCELDAAFFHLYGVVREDAAHIMDSFHIVKQRDEEHLGEYRTKRMILEIYDEMAEASRTGNTYQTRLDPPAADPRVAHSASAAREIPTR